MKDCKVKIDHQKQQNQQNNTKECNKCKKPGHTEDQCWQGKTFPTCKYCKKSNHPENKCRWKAEHEQRRNLNNKVSMLTESHVNFQEMNEDIDTFFVCDSGSTDHMCHEKKLMTNIKKTEECKIACAKKGENLVSNLNGEIESDTVILKNVNYVQNLSRNLLSISSATNSGATAIFDNNKVKFVMGQVDYKEEDVVLEGARTSSGLYIVDLESTSAEAKAEALVTQKQNAIQWHNKLGHINFKDLRKIPQLCDGAEESLKNCNPEEFCESCAIAKFVRFPFNTQRQKAKRPLEILHVDLCGKITPETYDGEQYFMTIMDDYTHYLRVYLMRTNNITANFIVLK